MDLRALTLFVGLCSSVSPAEVRLFGGLSPCSGRLEQQRESDWEPVRDQNLDWNLTAADQVCRRISCGSVVSLRRTLDQEPAGDLVTKNDSRAEGSPEPPPFRVEITCSESQVLGPLLRQTRDVYGCKPSEGPTGMSSRLAMPEYAMNTSYQSNKEGDAKLKRYNRKRRRDAFSTPISSANDSRMDPSQAAPTPPVNDCEMEPNADLCNEATVPKGDHEDLKQKYHQLNIECDNLRAENNQLRAENEELKAKLKSSQFSFASVKCKAAQVLFFTGLTSALFNWVLLAIKDNVELLRCALTLEDHLLAVLMKLRLGLTNKDIAIRFYVLECDISNLLRKWLPVMAQTLKPLIKWPSKQAILKNMPKCFKPKYQRCRCIIDCTEIFINRPTNLTARAQTYSNYKSHNTVKYLVGMSPAGAITFLSTGWGGRVSDKQLTAESGFYDNLEINDEILADRGFTIRDELALRGATLRIPHFTKGKKQLSAQEVETSRRLSNVRIHIERVIGRWKKFRILTTVVPLSQIDLLDDIAVVCAALTNICKCVPRK